MRCLRAIRGLTLKDRMKSEDILKEIKVRRIMDKMECRLRWYGHVKRWDENDMIRWISERAETGRRPRGRPRKRWMDFVRQDGRVVDLVTDRTRWRTIMRRPDPPPP